MQWLWLVGLAVWKGIEGADDDEEEVTVIVGSMVCGARLWLWLWLWLGLG